MFNEPVPALALPPMRQPGNVVDDLEAMKHSHREVARMHFLGSTHSEIAKEMGVTNHFISTVLSSPKAKAFLEELQGAKETDKVDLDVACEVLCHESVSHMTKIVKGEEVVADSLRLKAAMRGAEMGGRGPIQKLVGNINHVNVGQMALEAMKERGMEIWKERERKELEEIEVVDANQPNS